MRQVKEELKSWNETLSPEKLPREPADFSYWVAGNLPLDDTLKLHLLTIDSAQQRLRCELSIMKRVRGGAVVERSTRDPEVEGSILLGGVDS